VTELTRIQSINSDINASGTVSGCEWVEIYDMLQRHWPGSKRGKQQPRLISAARRMVARRRHRSVPPRLAFKSTVDYYEAMMPLMAARTMWSSTEDSMRDGKGTCPSTSQSRTLHQMLDHWPPHPFT
jgi:hypothetical protein